MTSPHDEMSDVAHQSFWGVPVTVENMHGTLRGNIHYPPDFHPESASAEHQFPAVLLLHGLGGNRDEHNGLFVRAAASLALAGIIALRFDFRGAGETGGETTEITVETQIQDAQDALLHLHKLPFVDSKRVALLGFSFGGLAAAILAARRKDVPAVVLWEAPHDMTAILKKNYGPLSLKTVHERGYHQCGAIRLSDKFFDALADLDVNGTIGSYSHPVFVVQGVEDHVVPVDTAYQWRRGFTSTETDVHLIQDADHAFTHEGWAWEAINHTVGWLRTKIGAL
jgi:dipeptidyl aminopeptidase/acylaminoacyl peptidase